MLRIKGLMPSLREKKRYLQIKILPIEGFNPRNALADIVNQLNGLLGIFDSADAGIVPVNFDTKKNVAIIKSSSRALDKVKAAMLFVSHINMNPVILTVTKVSGSLSNVKD